MISVSLTTSPRSRAFSSSSDKTPSGHSSSSCSSPRSGGSSRPSCLSRNSCLLSCGYTRPMANPPTQVTEHPPTRPHSPEWIESQANLRRKLERKGHNSSSARADRYTGCITKCRKISSLLSNCARAVRPWIVHHRSQGESHADDCRESAGIKTRALAGPRPQRSRHIVSAVRWRNQAGAMACCHGNDGQDRLWFKRNAGAQSGNYHHRVHRSLCDPAHLDPRRYPIDRLSRRRDGIASADRQPAVQPHPVRVLSRADGVGRAVVARQEPARVDTLSPLTCLAVNSQIRSFSCLRPLPSSPSCLQSRSRSSSSSPRPSQIRSASSAPPLSRRRRKGFFH